MGSKGGTTQQTSSSSGPPPQVLAEYQGLVNRATNVANQPFQPYQGEQVAPLTTQTLSGLGGISQYANAAQPYLQGAANMTLGNAGPVDPAQFTGMWSLSPFMNPYTNSVVGATQNELNNQNQQQAQFLNSANISSGAFGGDRGGVGQSILANQQELAEAPTIAGLNQANYNQALGAWQQQQGVNLAAKQADATRGLGAAAQLGQVGATAQQLGTQGAQGQIQAGMIPQAEQQQIDTAAQQMYQQGQAYPFTTTGWLGNIVEGTGSLSGGQSQTTSPGPNAITQDIGMATDALGMLKTFMPSDVRLKENVEPIGKTYDGQNIYRYNFRGDPRTQIGLLAQEEAYHDRGSVQRIGMGDMLGVDYHGATDEAAERGHFAGGGGADAEGEFQTPVYPLLPEFSGPFAQKPVTYDKHGNPEFPPVVEPEEQRWGGGRIGFQSGGAPMAMPPGGMTQGVMGGSAGGAPPQQSRALSPDYALMAMGSPGAREGLGSLGLLGGTNAHPFSSVGVNPEWSGAMQPRQSFDSGGEIDGPSYAEGDVIPSSSWRSFAGEGQPPPPPPGLRYPGDARNVADHFRSRQSFQGGGVPLPLGPNGQFGYATPGFQAGVDPLSAVAGVPEALFGEESAGGKNPYTGIDADQINAIGGGQWMPPVTHDPMPDWKNLGNTSQFGSAEASLSGLFGPGYTPGSVPGQTAAPAAPAASSPPKPGGMGNDPEMDKLLGTLINNARGAPQQSWGGSGQFSGSGQGTLIGNLSEQRNALQRGMDSGGVNVGAISNPPGRASGGRAGFQGGGAPGYYTPTTGIGRGPGTYVPPQPPPPPAIAIQRHLQGQARAKAAVKHGLVQPRVIAPDPVTGQHHDITPPQHPSTMRFPGWPTPGPAGSGGAGGPPDPQAVGFPQPRFQAKIPPEFRPPEPPRGPWETGPKDQGEPPPEAWPTGNEPPYGGRSTNYGPPRGTAAPEAAPGAPGIEGLPPPESPGQFLTNLPGRFLRGTPVGRAIEVGRRLITPDPTAAPTGVELPRTLGRSPSGPGPTINAPPPQSHVIDLGTWGGEGGAPAGRDFRGPPGQFDMPPDRYGGPPPADLDSDIMRMGDEGPQRYTGGRVGFDAGGGASTGPYDAPDESVPPAASDLSASDFASGLRGEIQGSPSGSFGWVDDINRGLGNFLHPNAGGQIDPRMTAQAPSGGGGGSPFTQVSLMGGRPISALDLSGHYTPTTGNARGASWVPDPGISPAARAQAPEHPAITAMRHIARTHGSGRRPGQNPGIIDPEIVARQRPWVPTSEDYLGGANTPGGGGGGAPIYDPSIGGANAVGAFQGGGGVMGSSPVMNAGGYTPQGHGMSGMTSQGQGLGSFATAGGAAGGFGDLFGGGDRAGFAGGGDVDPFLEAITSSVGQTGRGPGPPPPPKPAEEPAQGGGDSGSSPLGKLGSAAKSFKDSIRTKPQGDGGALTPADAGNMPAYDPSQQSAIDAATSGSLFGGSLDPANFATSTFFQRGGGVGLGALRGNFQDGGDTAGQTPEAFGQALVSDIKGAPGGSGTASAAPATGGGAAPVSDLINQNFGDRSGYASTIATRESGMGKAYVGDGGSSFGPFQLHYGGINKDMPHPGLGDEFTKQTGLDARDPKTVPDQIKFVANYTAKHGWHDWSTAHDAPGGGGANVPSAGAQPAQASTTSYGGGFQIPPGGVPPGQLDRNNLQAPTMGDELRHDPGGYMMSVGAAMMASRSPWLGVGIGEGLVAGNKYLQAQAGLEKEWGQAQAQINNLGAEAREHGVDADLKAEQLNIARQRNALWIAMVRKKFGGGDGTTSGGDGTPTGAPGTIAGGVGTLGPIGSQPGAGAAPTGGTAPSGGATPSAAPGATTVAGGAGATTTGIPDITQDQQWQQGQKLIQEGKSQNAFIGPGTGDDLIAKGEGIVKAREANWEAQKAPIQKEQETLSQKGAENFSDELKKVDDTSEARAQALERTERSMQLMKSWTPGAYAQDKAGLIAKMQDAGLDGWIPDKYKNYADSYQQFEKNSRANVMDLVKQMPGQPRVAEIDAFVKASAEGTKTPAANAAILAQGAGILDWQTQYAKDLANASASGQLAPRNLAKWKQDWITAHPVDQYMNARLHAFGYQGQRIPQDDKQKVDGQVYMNDRGQQAIWHADRKAFELMPEAF